MKAVAMNKNEQTPLVRKRASPKLMRRTDAIFLAAANVGLVLYVSVIISCLAKLECDLFIWHPICALVFIVLVTEGVLLLQPTCTPEEKKQGLQWHAIILGLAYMFAIAAFAIIVANKVIVQDDQFDSMHGQFGLTIFVYLFLQAVFGVAMAYVPGLFGGVKNAKSLWKFHRMSGYILLALVWVTALLGAHTDTLSESMPAPGLMGANYVALVLVAIGVAGRIRVSKMLGQHTVPQSNF
ncbi:eukaryotic cytochrome b561-domain-containing protein [Fennellomyces sp. T-0311]|nr:eukaryotic cytochrome b561-domain-containing protein [Fennellomyces sp. T-0311]